MKLRSQRHLAGCMFRHFRSQRSSKQSQNHLIITPFHHELLQKGTKSGLRGEDQANLPISSDYDNSPKYGQL